MDQLNKADKTRKFFLIGTAALLILIIGGLVWAVLAGSGYSGSNIDPNITFNDAANPSIGPSDARVTVRIYSDFQCPACHLAETAMEPIIQAYKDRVRFIWNDFPLVQIHPHSVHAAVAARCAAEQGNFWEYKQQLFSHQDEWSSMQSPTTLFENYAMATNLQLDGFRSCLSQERALSFVQSDFEEAIQMQVQSTPTFFINRKMVLGAISGDEWKKELDAALAESY